jgi:hypothetical protein
MKLLFTAQPFIGPSYDSTFAAISSIWWALRLIFFLFCFPWHANLDIYHRWASVVNAQRTLQQLFSIFGFDMDQLRQHVRAKKKKKKKEKKSQIFVSLVYFFFYSQVRAADQNYAWALANLCAKDVVADRGLRDLLLPPYQRESMTPLQKGLMFWDDNDEKHYEQVGQLFFFVFF